MTIATRDQLIGALATNSSRIIIDKASLASMIAGRMASLWRATGQPGQGAIPTTPALCTKALTGAIGFTNQTAPASNYLAFLSMLSSNATTSVEFHDRIAHMGGLSLVLTTAQTVGLDLAALSVPAERLGETDYSDLQWWLEVYADGGATASNATVNVTFNDGSTGNLSVIPVGGTLRIGAMLGLAGYRTAAQQALKIRAVNSVTLSASTAAAGNVGITVTRPRTTIALNVANKSEVSDWALLGLPEVPNDACLVPMVWCSTTSTGVLRGIGKIAHG